MNVSSVCMTVALLLLSLATNSEAGCRAYCKDTEILCLKSAHKRNWQMKWGRELAKQAQQAAQRAVNGNDKDPAAAELGEASATVKIKHVILDFAMRTESCRNYLQTFHVTIRERFKNGKFGCGVDWNSTYIAVVCLYKPPSS